MPLFNLFKKYSKNIALLNSDGFKFYYKDLIKISTYIKKKISSKSFIILVSDNSIENILLYIALLKNNCLVLIIDIKSNKEEFLNLLDRYKPNYIVVPDKFIKIKKNYKPFFKFYSNLFFKKNYNKKINYKSNLSILLSTSGTMGSQKFVKITKENIYLNTLSIIKKLNINSNDRAVINMPLSYSYMLSILNTHIHSGASIFITNYSFLQRNFWREIKINSITSFNGVPYIYETLCKIGLNNLKIDSLRYLTQAGGKLSYNINKKIVNFSKKNEMEFYSMYGQTEASPRIAILDSKYALQKIGSIGKAIPGGRIWLSNSEGKKITKSHEIGELIYFGKNVSPGYAYSYNDLTKNTKNNFTLKTGDLAYYDKDKFLFIKGRVNRIAKIYGIRFNLDELEQKLINKGYLIACITDNKNIYLCSEKDYSDNNLIITASKITMLNSRVFKCIKIEKFPRNISGKIEFNKVLENINV